MGLKHWFLRKLRAAVGTQAIIDTVGNTSAEVQALRDDVGKYCDAILELRYLHEDLSIFLSKVAGFVGEPLVRLGTEYPVASGSDDHRFPRGTAKDNTRYPRFSRKVEEVFGRKVKYLDLGCAGGGLVWDFLLRGHFAVGLEGSDYSLRNQRALWRVIPNHLFTCDITKPFRLVELKTESTVHFDIISCWEVLEHIREADLPCLLANIHRHLDAGGLFVASVATFEDFDRETGAVWHVTVKDGGWWENLLREHNFEITQGLFEPLDFPRGSGNGREDWSVITNPELGFHVVAKRVV
ncbi:MAG: class I SAM-dependent methyltransferase [Candidatus Binatia bacterium]